MDSVLLLGCASARFSHAKNQNSLLRPLKTFGMTIGAPAVRPYWLKCVTGTAEPVLLVKKLTALSREACVNSHIDP